MVAQRHLREFLTNVYRVEWWRETLVPHLRDELLAAYFNRQHRPRCDLMSEDWDNAILLDACRFDMFEELNSIPGTLERRWSKGSSTQEFLRENFADRSFPDTVYVTASPMYRIREWVRADLSETFHHVVDVWETGWDEEHGTVRPETMAEYVREATEEFPHKRLLVHCMQPHYPFLGETGQDEIGSPAGSEGSRRLAIGEPESEDSTRSVWERLRDSELSKYVVWHAYRENLTITLPHVREMAETLVGKTVVTSDHGNMAGERASPFPYRMYGHPAGIHTPELVSVPWLIVNDDAGRKTIRESEEATPESVVDDSELEDRLSDLGYL